MKYSEMPSPPSIRWDRGQLVVQTENSIENSALSIYEIQSTVNHADKVILLKGLQALGKEYKREFRLALDGVNPDSASMYRIYWVDPDDKRTELRVNGI